LPKSKKREKPRKGRTDHAGEKKRGRVCGVALVSEGRRVPIVFNKNK